MVRSVEQKYKQTFWILFRIILWKETHSQDCESYFFCFAKLIFWVILFRSEFRMHFLPRNNRNPTESILRNFSEQNSVPNPIEYKAEQWACRNGDYSTYSLANLPMTVIGCKRQIKMALTAVVVEFKLVTDNTALSMREM